MLKKNMKKRILIMLLWGFPLCFCGGVEFPEHSFAPSGNEHFDVEGYGSELVGSAEHPVPVDPPTTNPATLRFWQWYTSEGGQDWVRIHGSPWGIIANPDENWPSYVDPCYWEEFFEHYPDYQDEVENYFDKHPDAPNNPFRLSLTDDIGAIMGMILMGIAYGIFAYRVRRQ